MLAPQAYLRITQVGLEDPLGYVISVIMIAFSILALWLSIRVMKGKDYSTLQKGGAGIARRRLSTWRIRGLRMSAIGLVLLVVLSPHLGLIAAVVRTRLEFLRTARRLHAGQLRDGVRRQHRHDHQHTAVLRTGGARSTSSLALRLPI